MSGATGFIGSNLAKRLLEEGFKVYAIHRNSSSFGKCGSFKDQIEWINTDSSDWIEQIRQIRPTQFIHTAWSGTEAGMRNSWDVQLSNFRLSKEYFDLAVSCDVKKIIALGSQAEYGDHDFKVDENTLPLPQDAYGAVKLLTSNYLRTSCENANIEWYWIRIFSVFGEGENTNWLIPTVITGLLRGNPIPLTLCEQQYNYLYIADFINKLMTVVQSGDDKSGIYNICNIKSYRLKDLLLEIARLMNVSTDLLKFGAKHYRHNQNMIITADDSKLINNFCINPDLSIGIHNGLQKTIKYYQESIV